MLIFEDLVFIARNLFIISNKLLFKHTQALILQFYFFVSVNDFLILLFNDLFQFFNFSNFCLNSFLDFWLNDFIKFV